MDEIKAIKDSGERREFGTGAVRDVTTGKGRCDLLPLIAVQDLYRDPEIWETFSCLSTYLKTGELEYITQAIVSFGLWCWNDLSEMVLDISKHFENGAIKYGENNWKNGIPIHCYIDSAIRHLLKHLSGKEDENHDWAFVWNLMCAIWTSTYHPQLIDIKFDSEYEVKK